jgi:hypothetical protein
VLVDRRSGLRVQDRQPRSPLQVAHQRGPELGVVGYLHFVGRVEEQVHPAPALLLGELAIEVPLDHVGMASVLAGIRLRAAEHLGEERSHVGGMVGAHVGEDRSQSGIVLDALVETRGQSVQRVHATQPLVGTRDLRISHGTPPERETRNRVRRFPSRTRTGSPWFVV